MMRRILFICVLAVLAVSSAAAGLDEAVPTLIASGRVDEALTALRGQIDAAPNDPLAHNLLCRAYFSLGQWDRGIADCEKAVSLAPDNSQFHLWLGRIYGEKADKAGFMTAAGLGRKKREEFEKAPHPQPRGREPPTHIGDFFIGAPPTVRAVGRPSTR